MNKILLKENRKLAISYILMIAWMSIIFYFSHQPGGVSSMQSEQVKDTLTQTIPWVNNLFELIGPSWLIMHIIRKLAHMFLYFTLSVLSYSVAYNKYGDFEKSIKVAVTISVIYAAIDEVHQLYVPGRSGMLTDVWVDSIGVSIGVIAISLYTIVKSKKEMKKMMEA